MKYLKMFGLAALAAALMAFAAVGTASATTLESPAGTQLKKGTFITAESEGTTELHPPFGSINCKKSHISGTTITDGGHPGDVEGTVESLSFTECNATVTPLKVEGDYGTLRIASNGNGSGTLYGTNQEVTVVYLGFHCIFKTNNTKLGTVTGSGATGSNATLDIEATIPRTGGSSGSFCGKEAQWTGSYKVTNPNPLYVT
jgi:hypothetical protein